MCPHLAMLSGRVQGSFFWLHWVLVGVHQLSLVAASRLPIGAASLVSEYRF